MELCVSKTNYNKLFNQSFKEPVYLNGSEFKGIMKNGIINFPKYPFLTFNMDKEGNLSILKKNGNTIKVIEVKYYDGVPSISFTSNRKTMTLRPHRMLLDLFLGRLDARVYPVNQDTWENQSGNLNIFNLRFAYQGEHSKHFNKKPVSLEALENMTNSLIGNIQNMAEKFKSQDLKLPEINFDIKEEGDKVLDKIMDALNSVKRNTLEQLSKLKPEQQTVTIQIGNKEVTITGQNIKVDIKDI